MIPISSITPTKSEGDNRAYRALTLPNQLRVLLVSDPSTDKSAASLECGVGMFQDPVDVPGLAHFCEHMLFMVSSPLVFEQIVFDKYISYYFVQFRLNTGYREIS